MHTIFVGSDHAGFRLKQSVIAHLAMHYEVIDCGPLEFDKTDDYPNYAEKVCGQVLSHQGRGVLICDTGIGMSIAANRFMEIRAALVTTQFMAERSRMHNNANVLCLGQDVTSEAENLNFLDIWLSTDFSAAERHIRRLNQLDMLG
jgi:ribose 5-phosphate isomerase B